ncbi:hypothetical protein [Stenotrophomonas sp.]|uniref:hypothetical protein n=1 Tax=Stenotrophomonas sp. TaxID=69392 RepID=UPI002D732613|nr:hypothetical protein [Stenotrophomonas sp.]HYQ24480.1 hypothetical protein [Stenotrophomonas sp.]
MKHTVKRWVVVAMACGVLATGSLGVAAADNKDRRLGPCQNLKLRLFYQSKRMRTLNDDMQSWIDSPLREVVGKWGPPQGMFDNGDGSRIASWKGTGPHWGVCTKTFQTDSNDVLKLWSVSGDCGCTVSGSVPKSEPVPLMTL